MARKIPPSEIRLKVEAARVLAEKDGGQWQNIVIRHACGKPENFHATFTSGSTLFDARVLMGELYELEAYPGKAK